MPESDASGLSAANEPQQPSLSARLAAVEAERDRLQAELDARENESLASWLEVVGTESRVLGDMYNTLSWRVTKPLRFVRKVQIKAVELGPSRFSQLAVADLKRRYLGRRR
ncbi:hypothetical protein [Cryobacterium sp. Hz9]|uniref:hypothetical protein n=1 Tax=Cryobacterium sp. Hz9 TaxID=1259167 RepID=UPI00106C35B2|nr:hypothetical protein [Cryobacterium sp. Hz9]TFB66991.1 hypothetical protein E3N85_09195 [Cryobacterium sp. Hz9]